jgi:hypothetical protein
LWPPQLQDGSAVTGVAMTGEPDLVTLLYRADWTTLSLTAEVHDTTDWGLRYRQARAHLPRWLGSDDEVPVPEGVGEFRGRLLVAPGGRYRVETDRRDDPEHADPEPAEFDPGAGVHTRLTDPYAAMLRPVELLTGFVLLVREPLTVSGREAFDVVATPRPRGAAKMEPPLDRVEVVVDAGAGILLRREETFEGQRLRLTELTDVRFGPLAPEDAGLFPPGTDDSDDERKSAAADAAGRAFDSTGWMAARTAVNAAGAVLGTAVRLSPRRHSADADGDRESQMPRDEPFPAGWPAEDAPAASPISDELLHVLYRSGSALFTGTLHYWADADVLADWFRSAGGRSGWGGAAMLPEAVIDRSGSTHQVWRVRIGSGGRYRVDYLVSPGKKRKPVTAACDGEQRWRVYRDRVAVGPAVPVDREISNMVDASPLLGYDLAGETEVTFGGRRAFAVHVAESEHQRADSPTVPVPGALPGARVIVDAELGTLLLTVTRLNGKFAFRCEFRDVVPVAASGDDDGAFRVDIPPGMRVVRERGDLLDEAGAPESVKTVLRSAGDAARVAGTGVAAAKSFLDSLRGPRPER